MMYYIDIVKILYLQYSVIKFNIEVRMKDILLNVRTTNETKQLLKEAARMLGTTVSGFLLSSATKEAHELINNKTHFVLNEEQWKDFCTALDEKPIENKALKKLLQNKGVFDA